MRDAWQNPRADEYIAVGLKPTADRSTAIHAPNLDCLWQINLGKRLSGGYLNEFHRTWSKSLEIVSSRNSAKVYRNSVF